jgi:FtsH-binding integral membrane protein
MTAAFIAAVQYFKPLGVFVSGNFPLAIGACVGALVFCFMIICCFPRTHPTNLILLFLFTICETYSIGGLTADFSTKVVVQAGLVTALVTISLTIYAFRTKVQIEVFGALAFVVYLAMLPILIISLFAFPGNLLLTLYNVLGVLLYSLFLIIDTMLICNKGTSAGGRYAISYDDYVIGSLTLYLDIVMLFIYILSLFGKND